MKKYSVVIPCYNESENIPVLLDRFSLVIKRDDIEVLLVNNGSVDNSSEVMEDLVPQYPFARTVHLAVNKGYGNGILQGLAAAEGDVLGWTHADMQTDPQDVIKGFEMMEKEKDATSIFVKGKRRKRPLFDEVFTFGMSIFEIILLRKFLWDINAQPNIFHRNFYDSWVNPPQDFSLDLFVYYSALNKGLSVKRFDVFFPNRIHGESSWNNGIKAKLRFIKRTVDFSMTLRKKIKH